MRLARQPPLTRRQIELGAHHAGDLADALAVTRHSLMIRWHCTDRANAFGSPIHSVWISSSLRTRSRDVASAGLLMPSSGLASRYSFSTAQRTIGPHVFEDARGLDLRAAPQDCIGDIADVAAAQLGELHRADDRNDVLAQPPLDLVLAAQCRLLRIGQIGVDQTGHGHASGRLAGQHEARILTGIDVPRASSALPRAAARLVDG